MASTCYSASADRDLAGPNSRLRVQSLKSSSSSYTPSLGITILEEAASLYEYCRYISANLKDGFSEDEEISDSEHDTVSSPEKKVIDLTLDSYDDDTSKTADGRSNESFYAVASSSLNLPAHTVDGPTTSSTAAITAGKKYP